MKNIIRVFSYIFILVILTTCKKDESENRDFDSKISMESLVSVNTSEIGGNGLTLISSRDDDSPLSNKSFNTVVSKEGEQLLLVTDANKELRALTLSTPSSLASGIMQIDAHSTAISLVFISPGILTIEPQEAKTTISNIENLTSFSALKTYLTNNLVSKSLNDLSQEILYDSLLTDCIEEFFQTYKSIPKTSDKGMYEDKNRFSVNTLPNKQIEFSNSGFRFVDVVERDINSLNSQVGSIKEIVPQMKGGIGLSWGSLLTWSVANPTKDTITYSPMQNTSYTEFWVLGPGFKKYNDPLPQEIRDLNYGLPVISTGFYYLALPVLDLIAGVKSVLDTKSEMFRAFMISIKSTVSLSDITNAAQNQDVKGYKRGFINLSATIISFIAAQSATAAAGSFLATYGPPTAIVLLSTSVFFSTANLFGFFYDEARIERYAKYNIIPASGTPVVPTLVSPQNNSINISIPVKLAWTNSINASSYEIQISKNIGFSSLEFTESLISINQKEVSTLLGNTKYYWRVNSRNSNGTSDWSTIWSFTTVAAANNPPATPSSPSPTNGAAGISTSPTLTWTCTDLENDPMTFDVYLGTTNNPTTVVGPNLTTLSYSPSVLVAGVTYYWKVVAKDNQGNSTPGPVWSFTTAQNGTIPSNGLVAYYPFNGNANDESGNGNNGANNGALLATDRFGNAGRAMSFNGISSFIQIPTSSSFQNITNEITISSWIKKGTNSLQDQIIVGRRDNTDPGIHFEMQINPQMGLVFLTGGVGTPAPGYTYLRTQTSSYATINDGSWHNLVIVHKYGTGTSSALYIDGVLFSSTWVFVGPNYPANVKNVDVFIGKQNVAPPSAGFSNGFIDDIRIYNRVLTEQEIIAIYNE